MYEAWNCMSHLQTEGPRKARNRKDEKSVPRYRVKLPCLSHLLQSHYYRSPRILCNDENFLGFQFARKEHNASFIFQ